MSLGPAEDVIPIRCSTIELKDLADTDEFDLDAEVGAVYGFEYIATGFYKRKEILQDKQKLLKLEQLKNVEAELVGNQDYKIRRTGGKWHFNPIVEWDLKFEFISPYTMMDLQNKFRKALNAGPVLCSIIPDFDSRAIIDVQQYKKSYKLHTARGQVTSGIIFVPNVQFGENYTLIINIFIRDESLVNSNNSPNKILIGGVQINWQTLTKADQDVTVIIRKNSRDNIVYRSTVDKVSVAIAPSKIKGLSSIDLTHFDLISLYYNETGSENADA